MKIVIVLGLVLWIPNSRSHAETTTLGPLIRISADRITYSTPTSGKAEGNVLIEIPPDKKDVLMGLIATGEFATFDLVDGEVVLEGFPRITKRTYAIRATHSTDTVRFKLDGVMRTQGSFKTELAARLGIFRAPIPVPAAKMFENPIQIDDAPKGRVFAVPIPVPNLFEDSFQIDDAPKERGFPMPKPVPKPEPPQILLPRSFQKLLASYPLTPKVPLL